ncbi:Stk1 family PASTA domain-containing Ser/Thr kinase [Effusibacillus lacus]|uniref:Serine/threonine-protein kinase PrkC n=1 Tax=Effusibacillus lacus TaxID=1348429 RepID=A0A292YPL1_9BACL|nr:Stk1 family PASTA domain-containing Ser/Thr kinase [Effusibacillus lacus]TCS76560.1 serine/threonine-protein kinase [Effusibacillus lacus]GAX90420.1 serine/threonine protein kinase [Effusibacillus lacus]
MIGKKLANRYEILERIGGGGMAIVYRALDTILNRYVSVKVLRQQFVADEEFVRRFRREAQSAASLSHPNVVNIYDVGVEDETYFIVMEYINGKTLKEIIQERAPLPVVEAVDIAKQICSALQHAHDHQIVHRDIKPHNIMIGKDGHVKVTDFGIARAVTSSTITHNGSVIGSVHYFSPEQARGAITDVKSDIYSLGVVLYETLTGELPFSGETPISVALKHLQEHFVEPRQINPKIPQSVENIILKALAKNPEVRYQSAKEMYRDLDNALQNPNVAKFTAPDTTAYTQPTIQIPAAAFHESTATKQATKDESEDSEPKKRNLWKTISLIMGLLMLGTVGVAAGYTIMNKFMAGQVVEMPKVVGMPYDQAVDYLVKQYGFKIENIKKVEAKDPGEPGVRPPMQAGLVFEQDPESTRQVKTNRIVTLKVSTGAETIVMPNLEKKTEEEARKELADLNLDLSAIKFTSEPHKTIEKGRVIRHFPSVAVPVIPGQTPIEIFISSGPELSKVPDVRNKTLTAATQAIQNAGFPIGNIVDEYSYTVPNGQVIRQEPSDFNQDVPKDTKIHLWVSKGADPATQKLSYKVIADPDNGSTVTIKIVRKDARGQQVVVNDEKVTSKKEFPVELWIAPNGTGEIEVYENGSLKERKVVPYSR